MTRNGGDALSVEQLNAAVARGIITPQQREQLLALPAFHEDEARGGVNVVYIVYYAGAGAVLFALGWFLVDRWKSLHPAGVLAVSLLYALSFALASMLLSRLRFRTAGSLFALLAVGMAPIVAWCLESLAGLWPASTLEHTDPFSADVIASIRWIPIELSAALAALIALRRVRFSLLALAVALPVGLALLHLTPLLLDPELAFALWGWMAVLVSTVLLAIGYEVEQRTGREPQDYAGFVYLTTLGFLIVGVLGVADQSRAIPHSLPVLVAVLVALGIALRPLLFIATAGIFFVSYLGFLAASVFKTAVGFMVVIVAAGATLMLVTVLVQRRYPGLLRDLRDSARSHGASFPGARLVFLGAIAIALALLLTGIPRGRRLYRERTTLHRQAIREAAEGRRAREAAMRARRREALRRETPAPVRP